MKTIFPHLLLLLTFLFVNVGNVAAQQKHEYVDLGLPSGTLWATCNIGATNPEDYGDYFAWGEIETKNTYSWDNYKYANGASDKFTKYCNKSSYGYDGYTDSRTTLEKSDDVAYQIWGSDWCMPTPAQWQELKDKCTWKWTTRNGKEDYKVKGKNGNTIFLPLAGYKGSDGTPLSIETFGFYWSSSLDLDEPDCGGDLYFLSGLVNTGSCYRDCGRSVRPVRSNE